MEYFGHSLLVKQYIASLLIGLYSNDHGISNVPFRYTQQQQKTSTSNAGLLGIGILRCRTNWGFGISG